MATEVRAARPEDREAILAISAQIWEGEDYIPLVLESWLAEGGLVVAELDGRVVGFAKMTLLSPGEVWLEGLRVDPAHRGKGVAKALAHHQLQAALALHPRSIRFATAEVNAESLHIARNQGFHEVARFTYVEGPVRDEVPPLGVAAVYDPERAWAFVRASSAYREAQGLLGLGWRFPELTRERLDALVMQGAVFASGDAMRGLLIQTGDPYAPDLYAAITFLDGDDEALDALLRHGHAHAREQGQAYLSAMTTDGRVELFARHGLAPLPPFRYVLVLGYPLPRPPGFG